MKKSDLRSGMVVETREGNLYLVVGDFITTELRYDLLSYYKENMLSERSRNLDIMKVYEFKNSMYENNASWIKALFDREYLTLLWDRKEYKLTKREFEVLEALQRLGYEWLVRDKDNRLFAYRYKPSKRNIAWFHFGSPTILVDDDLFTFIKWTDDEPRNIKENIKSCLE